MKVFTYSLQGKRDSNEDQHVNIMNIDGSNNEYNPINLIGVFDGHGGKAISKYLKDNMIPLFMGKFKESNIYMDSEKASEYFNNIYNLMQTNIINDHPRIVQRCGSTACIGIHYKKKDKDKLWVLNVGDSRMVKCNKMNIAEQLTQDHKPNAPKEKNRIEQMGGIIEFDGYDWRINNLSLSRSFGDLDCQPYVTHLPEIYKYKISNTDQFIILACDGLWDVLSNQDAVDYINDLIIKNKKVNYAKELANHAYEKGSLDNITVIVYLLK